jgi:hypothetical protein
MRPCGLTLCFVVVLLSWVCFPQCATAQFLDAEVNRDLCKIGQDYVDELAALLDRSSDNSYPAVEAIQMHARHHNKFRNFYNARCPNCSVRDWSPCREYVKQLCTAISRWGQSHYPGLLSRPDGIEKMRLVLVGTCPNLVIPTLKKGNARSSGRKSK